ncbi:hypothetical protein ACFSBZ_05365 [Amnibacterium flavum]|uniref:hypothetical protein n=1 Tax=Amnibacterium flavum TaxID=2173173 RepID=UPI00140367AE|nr:hypothetical protein [Amnibacterium flavum]
MSLVARRSVHRQDGDPEAVDANPPVGGGVDDQTSRTGADPAGPRQRVRASPGSRSGPRRPGRSTRDGDDELSPDSPRGRRRAASRHRRSRSQHLSTWAELVTRYLFPGAVLLLLAGVSLGAWLVAPEHPGPLPPWATLVLVLILGPVVFGASRQFGLSSVGALLASALTTFLLTTASSDVIGVPEHAAVVAGLLAVCLWPDGEASIPRRWGAGALTGAAIAISPLALIAAVLIVLRLLHRPDSRRRRIRALLAPASLGLAVAVIGIVALAIVPGGIASTTWGGSFWFATVVVSVAPAIGVAAGIGADGALAAIGGRDSRALIAGVIGSLTLGLVLAATLGATISQIRDRVLTAGLVTAAEAVDSDSDDSAAAPSAAPSPTVTADEGTARRSDQGSQLLANPRLTTTPESRRLLEDGSVDPRIMIVLAQLLTAHDLTVADFPAVDDSPAAAGSVRRQLLVSEADGAALETGGGSIPALSAYLSGLSDEFAVESVSVDADGVLATFAPPPAE